MPLQFFVVLKHLVLCIYFENQVLSNNIAEKNLDIHWFTPTKASLERGKVYHSHNFEEEFDKVHHRNRQRGPRITRNPRTDRIEYTSVHFGFSRLMETGGLPKEVVRELKKRGLVN